MMHLQLIAVVLWLVSSSPHGALAQRNAIVPDACTRDYAATISNGLSNSSFPPGYLEQQLRSYVLTCVDLVALCASPPAPPWHDSSTSSTPQTSLKVILLVSLTIPLGLLALVLFGLWLRHKTSPRRRHNLWGQVKAPLPGSEATLVISDIENSTNLWEQLDESVMDLALHLHHVCIRQQITACVGIEAQVEGDSFTVAFHNANDATNFCLAVQEALMHLDWPLALLDQELCRPVYVSHLRPPERASVAQHGVSINGKPELLTGQPGDDVLHEDIETGSNMGLAGYPQQPFQITHSGTATQLHSAVLSVERPVSLDTASGRFKQQQQHTAMRHGMSDSGPAPPAATSPSPVQPTVVLGIGAPPMPPQPAAPPAPSPPPTTTLPSSSALQYAQDHPVSQDYHSDEQPEQVRFHSFTATSPRSASSARPHLRVPSRLGQGWQEGMTALQSSHPPGLARKHSQSATNHTLPSVPSIGIAEQGRKVSRRASVEAPAHLQRRASQATGTHARRASILKEAPSQGILKSSPDTHSTNSSSGAVGRQFQSFTAASPRMLGARRQASVLQWADEVPGERLAKAEDDEEDPMGDLVGRAKSMSVVAQMRGGKKGLFIPGRGGPLSGMLVPSRQSLQMGSSAVRVSVTELRSNLSQHMAPSVVESQTSSELSLTQEQDTVVNAAADTGAGGALATQQSLGLPPNPLSTGSSTPAPRPLSNNGRSMYQSANSIIADNLPAFGGSGGGDDGRPTDDGKSSARSSFWGHWGRSTNSTTLRTRISKWGSQYSGTIRTSRTSPGAVSAGLITPQQSVNPSTGGGMAETPARNSHRMRTSRTRKSLTTGGGVDTAPSSQGGATQPSWASRLLHRLGSFVVRHPSTTRGNLGVMGGETDMSQPGTARATTAGGAAQLMSPLINGLRVTQTTSQGGLAKTQTGALPTLSEPMKSYSVLNTLQARLFECEEGDSGATLVFRGLRVRMGMHSGIDPQDGQINPNTKRPQYSGACYILCKYVCDAACGGMVLLSSASLSHIYPDTLQKAAMAIHMGDHVLTHKAPAMSLHQLIARPIMGRLLLLAPIRSLQVCSLSALDAPAGFVTVVFMHVVGEATLMGWNPDVTSHALNIFQAKAGGLLHRLGGYLVEGANGFILASFSRADSAVRWALQCVQDLKGAAWPPELLTHELGEEMITRVPDPLTGMLREVVMLRGLRIRAGMDCGRLHGEIACVTGRMSYRGRYMNRAARIAAAAGTGQVLASADVTSACANTAAAHRYTATSLGMQRFKGVTGPVEIFDMQPNTTALMTKRASLALSADMDLHSAQDRWSGRTSTSQPGIWHQQSTRLSRLYHRSSANSHRSSSHVDLTSAHSYARALAPSRAPSSALYKENSVRRSVLEGSVGPASVISTGSRALGTYQHSHRSSGSQFYHGAHSTVSDVSTALPTRYSRISQLGSQTSELPHSPVPIATVLSAATSRASPPPHSPLLHPIMQRWHPQLGPYPPPPRTSDEGLYPMHPPALTTTAPAGVTSIPERPSTLNHTASMETQMFTASSSGGLALAVHETGSPTAATPVLLASASAVLPVDLTPIATDMHTPTLSSTPDMLTALGEVANRAGGQHDRQPVAIMPAWSPAPAPFQPAEVERPHPLAPVVTVTDDSHPPATIEEPLPHVTLPPIVTQPVVLNSTLLQRVRRGSGGVSGPGGVPAVEGDSDDETAYTLANSAMHGFRSASTDSWGQRLYSATDLDLRRGMARLATESVGGQSGPLWYGIQVGQSASGQPVEVALVEQGLAPLHEGRVSMPELTMPSAVAMGNGECWAPQSLGAVAGGRDTAASESADRARTSAGGGKSGGEKAARRSSVGGTSGPRRPSLPNQEPGPSAPKHSLASDRASRRRSSGARSSHDRSGDLPHGNLLVVTGDSTDDDDEGDIVGAGAGEVASGGERAAGGRVEGHTRSLNRTGSAGHGLPTSGRPGGSGRRQRSSAHTGADSLRGWFARLGGLGSAGSGSTGTSFGSAESHNSPTQSQPPTQLTGMSLALLNPFRPRNSSAEARSSAHPPGALDTAPAYVGMPDPPPVQAVKPISSRASHSDAQTLSAGPPPSLVYMHQRRSQVVVGTAPLHGPPVQHPSSYPLLGHGAPHPAHAPVATMPSHVSSLSHAASSVLSTPDLFTIYSTATDSTSPAPSNTLLQGFAGVAGYPPHGYVINALGALGTSNLHSSGGGREGEQREPSMRGPSGGGGT